MAEVSDYSSTVIRKAGVGIIWGIDEGEDKDGGGHHNHGPVGMRPSTMFPKDREDAKKA